MRPRTNESEEFWKFVHDYDINQPFSEYVIPSSNIHMKDIEEYSKLTPWDRQTDIMLEAFPNSLTTRRRGRTTTGTPGTQRDVEVDGESSDPYSIPDLIELMRHNHNSVDDSSIVCDQGDNISDVVETPHVEPEMASKPT